MALAVEVCGAGLVSVAVVVLWHFLCRTVGPVWGLWLLYCGTCMGEAMMILMSLSLGFDA